MCLTVPRRVDEVKGNMALMQDGRWVVTSMVGEVNEGDYLLVQANLAVEKVSDKQVEEMKSIIQDSPKKSKALSGQV